MALSVSDAVTDCSGIRAELRSSLSFNSPVRYLIGSAFRFRLFQFWFRKECARRMGAVAAWSLLLDGAPVQPLQAPTVFNLDGIAAVLDI